MSVWNLLKPKKEETMDMTNPPANPIVQGIVTNLTNDISARVKQEMLGESEVKLKQVLQKYKSKVTRLAYHASQKWCKWSDDGPVMMPDYTRMYYRKGDTEAMVMEFPPALRLMRFKNRLLYPRLNEEGKSYTVKDPDKIVSFTLALPYVGFIFKFVEGMFQEVYTFFSPKPLSRLSQKPCKPYMSNVENFKVCMGREFVAKDLTKELEKGNLTQQAALVLFHFWNTVHSDEWSSGWWTYKDHFANDERLADPMKWQEASVADPLFVIDDVNWIEHNEELGDLVVRLFDQDQKVAQFQQELFAQASDTLIDDFEAEVNKTLAGLASKVNIDTHVQALIKAIQQANPKS